MPKMFPIASTCKITRRYLLNQVQPRHSRDVKTHFDLAVETLQLLDQPAPDFGVIHVEREAIHATAVRTQVSPLTRMVQRVIEPGRIDLRSGHMGRVEEKGGSSASEGRSGGHGEGGLLREAQAEGVRWITKSFQFE